MKQSGDLTTERTMNRDRRNVLWPRSIILLIVCAAHVVAQQSTPTPRPGRSYSSDELPKTPPPPGPKGLSPVTFADVTALSKINFKHAGSPTSQKYLLETMGGGVAIFDY